MNAANSLEAWTDRLEQRPERFPHQLDLINDNLLLVELSAAEINAASFLDQRVLKPTTPGTWIPWQVIADIFDTVTPAAPARFIFHVGHCGSTLLSRLLQHADDTQCLREPLPLRTLARDAAEFGDGRSFLSRDQQAGRLQALSKMWRRGAAHTVIKATSICTDLLPLAHAAEPSTRSVFVYNRAETHIATLLAGDNSLADLRGFAPLRLQRLQQRTGLDLELHRLDHAQLAALSWLSETSSASQSLEQFPGQVEPVDFETLIDCPAETLAAMLHFLDIPATEAVIQTAVGGPVLQTYSKAPEVEYNSHTRAAILADSRAKFGAQIDAALAWLEDLSSQSGLVAASMRQFA